MIESIHLAAARFSRGEEQANYLSHGAGALLSVAALAAMLIKVVSSGKALSIAAVLIYGITLVVLYTSSMLNHWLPPGNAKEFMFSFDQVAVYMLIAGTYTPFALIAFEGTQGWVYFGIEWGLALAGTVFKIFQKQQYEKSVDYISIVTYVVMGWLIFADIPYAISRLTLPGFLWIVGGGLFYTTGIIFFKLEKLPYNHLVWHIFVLAGSALHFTAIWFFVLQ